jgi:signal transduction histidine kinase
VERTRSHSYPLLPTPLQLGMLLLTVVTALVAATFVLAIANQYTLTLLGFVISQPLAALVGGLIIARQPRNLVGWCIVGHAFCFTLGEFCRQYALYGAVTNPGGLPFAQAMAWPAYWLWGPGIFFGFMMLPLYFPNGQLVSPCWRWAHWYAIVLMLSATVAMAFAYGDYETPGVLNPLGMLRPAYIETVFGRLAQVGWMVGVIVGVISLFVRFRRASAQEKQQIKWIFYAMLLLLAGLFVPLSGTLEEVLGSISITALWIAIGIAVLRYRLYNIDIIISRTLVYATLTAIIVSAYVLTVGLLGTFVPSGGNLVNALIAVGLVALIFNPLRERLQRGVNRLLYGERDEPYALLTRLGRRLEETLAPDQALPTAVETVATALKLPYVAIALGDGDGLTLAAEYIRPTRPGMGSTELPVENNAADNTIENEVPRNLVSLPLTHQRQHLGELRLALRPGEQSFGPADWRLLNELARQIGVAISGVQLTHALQVAREQLIVAREEERRRLRRDLHDGLGPVLAAQRLKLGSARYFLTQNPTVADRLLAEQERDIEAALQEVRRLIDNLRPPALDDLGLAVAIQRIAAQYGITGDGVVDGGRQDDGKSLQIEVDVPDALPPLPAAVEVACYRIVQEALTNVVRHANARHCRVMLTIVDRAGLERTSEEQIEPNAAHGGQTLLLTICDDGRGIKDISSNGLGLHSMRARAEELGGTMTIQPNRNKGTNRGTLLRIQLPVPTV